MAPKPKFLVSMVVPVSLDLQTKDIAVCVLLDSWVNAVNSLKVVKYNGVICITDIASG